LVVSLPLFLTLPLLGGVSPSQVFAVFAVIAVSVEVSAVVGTEASFWREKTFQSIAMTFLILLLLVAAGEIVAGFGADAMGWATAISPTRALVAATNSISGLAGVWQSSEGGFLILGSLFSLVVLGIGIAKVR